MNANTSNQMSIGLRKNVPLHETWDLTQLFENDDKWKTAFEATEKTSDIKKKIESQYKNMLATSPEVLFQALRYRDVVFRTLSSLSVYAHLRSSEDVGDPKAQTMVAQIDNKFTQVAAEFAFLQPEAVQNPLLGRWLESAPLNEYAFELKELIRSQKHVLSEKEEVLLTKLSEPMSKFREVHSKWNNVDLKFPEAQDANGNQHMVSNSRLLTNLTANDRILRKNTFLNYYGEISKWRNTISTNFLAHLQRGSIVSRIRGFSGYRDAKLFADNIPHTVYDGLIQSARDHLEHLHKSMQLRSKVLKVEKVAPYDRNVSLSAGEPHKFSWEAGVKLVLECIAPLGDEYVEIARRGLTQERWVDHAENQGKRSGAFSSGCYDSKPYILMTWTGTLENVYTLAHELGHSMHTYYSNKNQPFHLANYTIFVAEVASTLIESLLTEHILKTTQDPLLRSAVLSHHIQGFEATVFRQTLFATFERDVCALIDADAPVTVEQLDEIYFKLNKEWYGEQADLHPFIAHEWMRIPHFYSTFYVYKYATSYCASQILHTQLRNNEKAARKNIMEFLGTGGSKSPLDTMLATGVDFSHSKTLHNAFLTYGEHVSEGYKVFSNPS